MTNQPSRQRRMSQIAATPRPAEINPPIRTCAAGIAIICAIRRFMPSGNTARAIPSITKTRANAVAKSYIAGRENGRRRQRFGASAGAPLPFADPKKRKNSLSGDSTRVVSRLASDVR